jgi:quinol-cytochrome oxidoreductase complex cytochrome b subunit
VSTFRRIFIAHVGILPVILLVLAGAIVFVVQRREAADSLGRT